MGGIGPSEAVRDPHEPDIPVHGPARPEAPFPGGPAAGGAVPERPPIGIPSPTVPVDGAAPFSVDGAAGNGRRIPAPRPESGRPGPYAGCPPPYGPPPGYPPHGSRPGLLVPPPPSPADVPPPRWGLGAYLLVEVAFLLTSVLLVLPWVGQGGQVKPPPGVLLLGLTVPTVLSAVVAVVITYVRGNGPVRDLGLRITKSDLAKGLAFGSAGLILTVPAAALWAHVVGSEQATSAVAELFAGQRFPVPLAIAVFLAVWLLAPVCEEIVYRGLLWGAMEKHGARRWWAFALTTLVFAVAHFEFTRTPLLLVISIPIGLCRLYTGRIGASIVAHQLNNLLPAISLLMLLLGVLPPQ